MGSNCIQKKVEYHRSCTINPKCCLKLNELEFPTHFKPPVLGTSGDFCREALSKAIPIKECILAKPEKLQITTELAPEGCFFTEHTRTWHIYGHIDRNGLGQILTMVRSNCNAYVKYLNCKTHLGPKGIICQSLIRLAVVPPTHRYIKNWQKWCRIWKRNQDELAAGRNDPNPPLMTCGEGWSYRKEDTELFDRTLHPNYLTGYNIKNAMSPDGLNPSDKNPVIREVHLPRYSRKFPQMKRYRYARRIRDEMGLPIPCPSESDEESSTELFQKNVNNYSDAQQDKGEGDGDARVENDQPSGTVGRCLNWEDRWRHYSHFSNWMLTEDLMKHGYPRPKAENLIFQQPTTSNSKPERMLKSPSVPTNGNTNVPRLTFTLQDDENLEEGTGGTSHSDHDSRRYYNEVRGPVLQVMGEKVDLELRYKASNTDKQFTDPFSQQFFFEDWESFSATTRGKETRFVTLKNEGTTAVRYQWLRFPPSKGMGKMLCNPARYLGLGGDCPDNKQKFHVQNVAQKESQNKTVSKPSALEFRFRELPGVLLPGQTVEFPIVFRSVNTGYYYETLYLLTHPNLTDDLGRSFAIRLTGNCADPDLAVMQDTRGGIGPRNVVDALTQITLEQEASSVLNVVLDHALFKENRFPCSLPFGKVTTEGIFYTHNKDLYYHYGTSEKSLETVRNLIEMLVPQERLIQNDDLCTLSIQSLYKNLWNGNTARDYYWTVFKSAHAEKQLKNLANLNNILIEPRIFAYPCAESRAKTACYTTLLSVFDEILTAMDNIDELYSSPEINKIYEETAQVNVETGRLSALNENYINPIVPEIEFEEAGNVDDANEKEPQLLSVPDETIANNSEGDNNRLGVSGEKDKRKSNQSGASGTRRKTGITQEPRRRSKPKDKATDSRPKSNDNKDTKSETVKQKKDRKKKRKEEGLRRKTEFLEVLAETSAEEEEVDPFQETDEEEFNMSIPNEPSEDEEMEVETPPPPGTPPGTNNFPTADEDVKNEINGEVKVRTEQLKRIMFGRLFSSGIERMVNVVDEMKSMEDYRTSVYVNRPAPTDTFCCDKE